MDDNNIFSTRNTIPKLQVMTERQACKFLLEKTRQNIKYDISKDTNYGINKKFLLKD